VDSITSNLPAIVLILAGLGLVAMLILQALQISQLRQRLDMLTRGADGESLEGVFDAHLELVHQVSEDLDDLTARTATLEATAAHHFARAGLVRFNPFPDTGGNQSFALAMLDESDNGFIVSSLHSRTGTRIYAKAIAGGRAENTLSTEEAEAIDQARATRPAARAAAAPTRTVRTVAPAQTHASPDGAITTPSRVAPAPAHQAPAADDVAPMARLVDEPRSASAPFAEPVLAPARSSGFLSRIFGGGTAAVRPRSAAGSSEAVEQPPAETGDALSGPLAEVAATAAARSSQPVPAVAPEPAPARASALVPAGPSADQVGDRKVGAAGQSKAEALEDDDSSDAASERTGRRPAEISPGQGNG
jgi:hypothetical protein